METLSKIERNIIEASCDGYTNASTYKMQKYNTIMEKIKNDESNFEDSECILMFEFLAGFASSEYSENDVMNLRDKLRNYKFPNDATSRQ